MPAVRCFVGPDHIDRFADGVFAGLALPDDGSIEVIGVGAGGAFEREGHTSVGVGDAVALEVVCGGDQYEVTGGSGDGGRPPFGEQVQRDLPCWTRRGT